MFNVEPPTPQEIMGYIIPEWDGAPDDLVTLKIAEGLRDLESTPAFKFILHLIASVYRDTLNQLASPAPQAMHPDILKGRLWGLGEVMDAKTAIQFAAESILTRNREESEYKVDQPI